MDIEKFILGVFERKALWDQTNKDYHNRDKMWLSLAQEMNESSEVTKSKWRGLRDNFRKELAKTSKGRSGDPGGVDKSKWSYFNMMLFLKGSMAHRSGKGNIPPLETPENIYEESTSNDFVDDNINNCDLNSEYQEIQTEISISTMQKSRTTEDSSNAIISTPGTSHRTNENISFVGPSKAKKTKSSVYEKMILIEEEKFKALKEKYKEKPKDKEDNSDFHFLMSLLPYMKQIPEDKKLSVHIKMQQLYLEELQSPKSDWTRSNVVTLSPQSSHTTYTAEDESS